MIHRTLHGEAKWAPTEILNGFKPDILTMYEKYDRKDIFNIDEWSIYQKHWQ